MAPQNSIVILILVFLSVLATLQHCFTLLEEDTFMILWIGGGGPIPIQSFKHIMYLNHSPETDKDAATQIVVSMCYQGEFMCNPCKLIQK